MSALIIGVALVVGIVLVALIGGQSPRLGAALGLSDIPQSSLPIAVSVVISPRSDSFNPRVAVAVIDSTVTFINQDTAPVVVRSAGLDPEAFSLRITAHGQGSVHLARPGLYHYYDALRARPSHVVAGNDVIVATAGSGPPLQGWIAVLADVPGLNQQLTVPPNQDLFMPKALVTVVGSTITVANHDTDAHNFVVDPASPAGAAFIIHGTDTEPPSGWQRALVVRQPGIYHIYCTLHTITVGTQDGWRVVVSRPTASGYADHNPMESWIIVLPAYATK
jgi:plastocyanin